jgi:hypothetical protein
MLRRVAFRKAVLAGAAGAVAWEVAARLALWAGLPLFDLVRTLGTLALRDAPAWQWWPLGLAIHAAVGAIWAIFYAYFFWSSHDWKPLWQGVVFSLGPAVLAGLIMVPQMAWMHPLVVEGRMPHPGVFAWRLGWGGPAGVFVGHLVYGAVLGLLYVRPVGYPTAFENERRFIALDLLYGVEPREHVRQYLLDHGMSEQEYDWFMHGGRRIAGRCVLGVDYYEWNEKLINSDGRPESLGELFGWYVITKQYHDRYRRPLMHTETNCQDARKAPDWIWRQWHNVQLMRRSGVPVVGFTWYSLVDQVDWNIGLGKPLGNVNPVGLYDINRDLRPVAESYRRLVRMFADEPLAHGEQGVDLPELLGRDGGGPLPRSYEHTDTCRAPLIAP